MALLKKTQRSFSGGMIDKDLTGRQDLSKYSQGCLTLENFKVRKQGNIIKRSGTDLVCDFSRCLGNGTDDVVRTAKLVPIVQERESGFYLLLTGGRAFLVSPDGMKMNNGTWSRTPVWAALAAWAPDSTPEGHAFDGQPEFADGVWTWTDQGGLAWTAEGSGKDVRLKFTATVGGDEVSFAASLGGGVGPTVPYSVEVPFADADLRMIDWCQSGDTIFFAHRSYPPGKIVLADGMLTYERHQFRQGLGTPPRIEKVEAKGGWGGSGALVHLEYVVTAVKDGVETGMSIPYAIDYRAPWSDEYAMEITIDTSGLRPGSWDAFYIYKKIADVFGLIGTTSNQTAFVSVSEGFSVGGSLYPSGYTQFDKNVHLRESGNKFASVSVVTNKEEVHEYSSPVGDASKVHNPTVRFDNPSRGNAYLKSLDYQDKVLPVTTTSVNRSATATKKGALDGDSKHSITFGFSGVVLSSFSVKIGTVEHQIDSINRITRQLLWYFGVMNPTLVVNANPETTILSNSVSWEGKCSLFHACPAKWFKAKVEYEASVGTWIWSTEFNCKALVDQSNPGSGWISQGGGVWRKDSGVVSTVGAAEVLALMEKNVPSVGATVEFGIPDNLGIKGKRIRKITLYGYESEATGAASAGLIVNGIACYQGGAYVNTFTDGNYAPDLTYTPPKTEDHFINPGEFPGCVQLYSQRLVYAASAKDPFTLWMSQTGDLTNFDTHEYLRASDAITASTAALEMPRINRMLVHRDLMLFAEGGEWQVAPSSGNAIAPSTIAAKLQSTVGCAAWLKPIPIDSDIIFCDSSGETLMATRYNFASDGYDSSNLSVLSQRLFRNNRIVAMAYVQFPESTVECVLQDGTVASLVYMKEHEVCAWSKHVFGGGWKALDVAANKSVVAGSSHCAFIANRRYRVDNNGTQDDTVEEWAILGLRDIDPNDTSLKDNLRMDAVRAVTVERATPTAISGQQEVPHEEPVPPTPGYGETVVKIGEVVETVDEAKYVTGDVYAIGCAFKSVLKTTSPEFTDQETAQMEIKNATESEVRVIDGSDFTVRQPEVPAAKATRMRVPCEVGKDGESYTLAPGDADCRMLLVGTNSRNGSVVLEHDGYYPLAVLSVTTSYRIEYANHANGGSNNGRD